MERLKGKLLRRYVKVMELWRGMNYARADQGSCEKTHGTRVTGRHAYRSMSLHNQNAISPVSNEKGIFIFQILFLRSFSKVSIKRVCKVLYKVVYKLMHFRRRTVLNNICVLSTKTSREVGQLLMRPA